ncbi:MAG: AbrB/MazE/SpoVT family DNA-binding domain-containing protein [Candidatus Eremiobacteraeota bacterium]|nr:AbrB/MazE/SpoVT family DNA-binding domain-containing protein [Candidatus Eremiobacteraeota bacterium]MCW5868682.1 AbrB/MazE/SpoVT family DNA-binding domain-containing protein [Candidatus Eremiobacteraeota bacterium]
MPGDENKWRARLFTNGKSQAVRLPKALRFQTDEVLMWREGDRIILEPAPKDSWPEGYREELDELASLLGKEEPMNPAFLDLDLD